MVTDTLAVDRWTVTVRRGLDGLRPAAAPSSPFLAVPNVTAHPSTANVQCGTIITFAL